MTATGSLREPGSVKRRGARFDRFVEFTNADGKVSVRAHTEWAIIDKALGRPIRVPPEVVAPFRGEE